MDSTRSLGKRWRDTLVASLVAAMIAGCGGSGAGGQGSETASTETAAAALNVGASAGALGSSGTSSVTLSATVKTANNVALRNQPVTFSTTDSGVTLSNGTVNTDASGVATTNLVLNDPTLRSIPIKARTGQIENTLSIDVVGTNLAVSGPQSLGFGASASYAVSVTNSEGTAMPGATVALASRAGNTISPATARANASGQATFTVTGSASGADTLTASSLGAASVMPITVSGNLLSFGAPSAAAEALVNVPQPITLTYRVNGVPVANAPLTLTATRGALAASTLTTDAAGQVSTTIVSTTAGQSIVTATAADGSMGSVQFEFVSRTPAAVALQASPTTVSVNAGTSTSSTSTLLARVRDATGNPVKGVRVDFSAVADPSNGYISPAFATTNSSGVASTAFIAGPNSSGSNQVRLRAAVAATSITAEANMTVARQALSVRINTGNVLKTPDSETYVMPFTAVVTDSAGNPVSDAAITVSYTPTRFNKGYYTYVTDAWVPTIVQSCVSEDANGDGTLNAGEDLNGNAQLDPGNVAAAYVASADYQTPNPGAKTDASGFGQIGIKYSRGFANWVGLNLMVTITAPSGSETVVNTAIPRLPPLNSDLSDKSKMPPGGVNSRFGIAAGCDNTN